MAYGLDGDNQFYVVRAGVYPDPAAWGILLVDLARSIANTYEDSAGAFCRIQEGYAVRSTRWVAVIVHRPPP